HARTFLERDNGNRMRGLAEIGARAVIDHIGIEGRLAARLVDLHLARTAGRTEGAGRKIALPAACAALKSQFSLAATLPEMPGFRRRRGQRPIIFRHVVLPDFLSLSDGGEDSRAIPFGKLPEF